MKTSLLVLGGLLLVSIGNCCHAQPSDDGSLKVGDRVLYRYMHVGLLATLTRAASPDDPHEKIVFVRYDGDSVDQSVHADDLVKLSPFTPKAGEKAQLSCSTLGKVSVLGVTPWAVILGSEPSPKGLRTIYEAPSIKNFCARYRCQ